MNPKFKKFYSPRVKTAPILLGTIVDADVTKVIIPRELFGNNDTVETINPLHVKSIVKHELSKLDLRESDVIKGDLSTNITGSPYNGKAVWSRINIEYTYSHLDISISFHHIEMVKSYIKVHNDHHDAKVTVKTTDTDDYDYNDYIELGQRKRRLRDECIAELTIDKFNLIKTLINTGELK